MYANAIIHGIFIIDMEMCNCILAFSFFNFIRHLLDHFGNAQAFDIYLVIYTNAGKRRHRNEHELNFARYSMIFYNIAIVRFDKLHHHQEVPPLPSIGLKIPDSKLLYLHFIQCQWIYIYCVPLFFLLLLFKVYILYSYYYISSLHMRYMLMHSFGWDFFCCSW